MTGFTTAEWSQTELRKRLARELGRDAEPVHHGSSPYSPSAAAYLRLAMSITKRYFTSPFPRRS